ncbi:MAG: hypothetical protein WD795_17700 [Woeseia sp.]
MQSRSFSARLAHVCIETGEAVLENDRTRMITCHDPNGIFIELQQYTDESMQTRGGVCRVDYTP